MPAAAREDAPGAELPAALVAGRRGCFPRVVGTLAFHSSGRKAAVVLVHQLAILVAEQPLLFAAEYALLLRPEIRSPVRLGAEFGGAHLEVLLPPR